MKTLLLESKRQKNVIPLYKQLLIIAGHISRLIRRLLVYTLEMVIYWAFRFVMMVKKELILTQNVLMSKLKSYYKNCSRRKQ